MVSVFFGDDTSAIDVSIEFRWNRDDVWFDDPFVREMVRGIDKSEVLSRHCIQSPVLGQIPPEYLSGGVKACIMLWCYGSECPMIDLEACGENCQPWLSRIFAEKDIRVCTSSCDLTFKGLPIKGICENDGSEIKDSHDWVMKMVTMVGEYTR